MDNLDWVRPILNLYVCPSEHSSVRFPTEMFPICICRQIKSLSKHVVVQIACGGHHNLALLQGM